MTGFPADGLQLYVLEINAPATPAKVYCIAWDTTAPSVAFKPVLAATPRTPTQIAAAETGTVYAAINGGYFGGNQSFSLVQHAGSVLSANVKSLARTFQGAATTYFPTRAASPPAVASLPIGSIVSAPASHRLSLTHHRVPTASTSPRYPCPRPHFPPVASLG